MIKGAHFRELIRIRTLDDFGLLKNLQDLVFSLSCRYKLLFLALGISNDKLSMLRLEVVSLNPRVIGPLRKLFLKICNCVHLVEVLKNFCLYLIFAHFAFSDPKEPLFLVIALQKLHANKGVTRRRSEFKVLPSQAARIVLKHGNLLELALPVNLELRCNVEHRCGFPLLYLFFETIKFDF